MTDGFGPSAPPVDLFSKRPEPPRNLVDEEDDRRRRESEAIASRVQEKFAERGVSHMMSPDFIATQPKTLIERLRVTPEEQEDILFHFASTSSVPKTVSLTGLPVDKVRAVVYAPASQDSLQALRSAMRLSVIRKMEETQNILLEALQDPTKLNDASLTQISTVFAQVSETQLNLLNATRSAQSIVADVDPAAIFSGDELEYMAYLRRRLSATSSPAALPPTSGSPADGLDHSEYDDFVDPDYAVSPSAIEVDVGDSTELDSHPRGLDPIKDEAEFGRDNLDLMSEFAKSVMAPPDPVGEDS